jgi:hypothetical protein
MRRLLLCAAALLAVGCKSPPTSVLVKIVAGSGLPAPDTLSLAVFGESGVDVAERMLPACDGACATKPSLPGEVVLFPREQRGRLRLLVRARQTGSLVGEGTGAVELREAEQIEVVVTVNAGPMSDRDGDGVPDIIDLCPDLANPQQGPCARPDGRTDARPDVAVDAPRDMVRDRRTDRPRDQKTDKPKIDKPKDKPAIDKPAIDKPKIDRPPDVMSPDKPVDLAPSLPCDTVATTAWTSNDQQMAICYLVSGFNQCNAASYCGSLWHMCTAAEYLARFSITPPPAAVVTAWLAGCIRDGGSLTSVSNTICSTCTMSCASSSVDVYIPCGGVTGSTSTCPYIGVMTASGCYQIGSTGTKGMWQGTPSSSGITRVACCR